MDYPHPYIQIKDGELDFSDAYDTGIGEWDKVSVAYAYSDFGDIEDETSALNAILEQAHQDGLRYISDQDARPQGGAHGGAHLWDNGGNASAELQRILEVRQTAIQNFSIDNIRTNEPLSVLEDVFVPLYFFHRYQTEAAVKLIGGQNYSYAVKGGSGASVSTLPRAMQEEALDAVLQTLDAGTLAIPDAVLSLLPPRAQGYGRSRESFQGKTGVSFDAISAAETAADYSLGLLLHPERASRLVQNKAMDSSQLGFQETLEQVVAATMDERYSDPLEEEIRQTINFRLAHHLMHLAAHSDVLPAVNALAANQLGAIRTKLLSSGKDVYAAEMVRRIDAFFKNKSAFKVEPVSKIPDGSPIGMACMNP